MRRYVHNILASLMCVCLLVSYTPLPASADEAKAPEASVGPMEDVDAATGQAVTEVKVLSYETLTLSVTADFAASIEEIRGNDAFDLKAVAEGAEPLTYQWFRAVVDENGAAGERTAIDGATEAVYPLSHHTDTLVANTSYVYTVQVTAGDGATKEASVNVTVSDGYVQTTLPDEQALPRVGGLSIHSDATLSSAALGAESAAYGFLQQAANGLKLDASAWQLDLTGAPDGKAPFVGNLSVTLPVNLDELPAEATSVQVVCLDAAGATSVRAATLDRASASATFMVGFLGVFAAAYPVPADETFAITATAGEGGSIAPAGTTTYAKGVRAVYTVLSDEGFRVQSVQVDGAPVKLTGNTYAFDSVEADHTIEATFERFVPDNPQTTYAVTARVEGGNGQVRIDGGALSASASAQVKEGTAATVTFVPADGYVVDAVTVQEGEGEPQPVNVFGDAFLLSAVTADTTVVVTFKPGVAPPVLAHAVTATATEGGTVSPASQTVPHGRSATVSVRAKEGFTLESVLVNGQDVTTRVVDGVLTLQNVVQDVRVEATFVAIPQTYTVTAEVGEGGSLSPAGERTVEAGQSVTYYIYPDQGWELDKLTLIGSDGQARDVTGQVQGGVFELTGVDDDLTLSATFRALAVEPPADTYYAITATAGKGGSVSPVGTTRVKAGGSATFYFVPDEGYTLESVLVNGKAVAVSGFSYTLSGISANATVAATFRAVEPEDPDVPAPPTVHTIAASAGPGGSISPAGDVAVVEGGSMPFSFLPDAGYELDSVTVDDNVYKSGDPAIQGNVYRFDNVTTGHAIAAAFKAKAVEPAEPDHHLLTVEVAGGQGTVTPAGTTRVAHGATQTVSLFPAEGFKVASVTLAEGDGNPVDVTSQLVDGVRLEVGPASADLRVSVTFARGQAPDVVKHTVTATASEGGTVSPEGTIEVADGGSLSFVFSALDGYVFKQALVTQGGKTAAVKDAHYTLKDIVGDCAVEAQFEKAAPADPGYRTVQASATGGGTISPAGSVRVAKGEPAVFYLYPDAGHKVEKVLVNGTPVACDGLSVRLDAVDEDATVQAVFAPIESGEEPPVVPERFALTATASAGGTVSPSGTAYVQAGGQMLYTFTPEAGYHLARVAVDDVDVTSRVDGLTYRFVGVGANHALHVEFAKDADVPEPMARCIVQASVAGGVGGSVSPSGSVEVPKGASTTFYFLPEEGYQVSALRVGDGEPFAFSGLSYTLSGIETDTALEVTFAAEPGAPEVPAEERFAATAAVKGGGGTVSPASATVLKGGSLLFTVTPDEGNRIASVTDNGRDVTASVGANGGYRVRNVQENHAIEAAFEAVPVDGSVYCLVHASAEGGGAVSPAGDVRVAKGGAQTFALVPDAGKKLVSVIATDAAHPQGVDLTASVDKATWSLTLENVQSDTTVIARFGDLDQGEPAPVPPVAHPVTATCTTGGSVSPAGTFSAAEDTVVHFAFAPDAGYELAGVTVNGQKVEAANNLYALEVGDASAYAVHAEFKRSATPDEPVRYRVTATVEGEGGTVSPAGTMYVQAGESQSFAFFPDDGYALDTVTVDGQPVRVDGYRYTLLDVAAETNLVATFRPLDQGEEPPVVPAAYTIATSATAGGIVSPSGAVRVAEGSSPLVTFVPDAGYHLASVLLDGQDVTGQMANGAFRFAPVADNHELHAVFERDAAEPVEPASYLVTASVDGEGGTVSPAGSTKVAAGGSQTFSFIPDPGYVVDSVTVDGSTFKFSGTSYTLFGVKSNMRLSVTFKKDALAPEVKSHTVTASASAGGTISPEGAVKVADGANLAFSFTALEGYELYRVVVDADTSAEQTIEASELVGGQFRLLHVESDHTVRALFKKTGTEPEDPSDPDKPTVTKVVVQASAGEHGSIDPSGDVEVPLGADQTFTFKPDEGYHVASVQVNGQSVDPANSYTMRGVNAPGSIHVEFEPNQTDPQPPEPSAFVTVHASAGEGGTVSPAGDVQVPKGGSQTFYFVPDEGKKVDGLVIDGKRTAFSGSAYTLFNVTAETTLLVEFVDLDPDEPLPPKPVLRTVSATAGPGGAVSPAGDTTIVDGGSLLLAFVPDEGYETDEVRVGNEVVQRGGTSYRLIDVRADVTVSVTFKQKTELDPNEPLVTVEVKVEAHAEGGVGGMVSPSGTLALAHGASQTFHVFPEEGYDLERVVVDGVEVQADPVKSPRNFFRSSRAAAGAFGAYRFTVDNVTKDTTISVSFRPLEADEPAPDPVVTHEVQASASEGGMISPSGSAWVVDGGSVSFALKADDGWQLASVTANNRDVLPQVKHGMLELTDITEPTVVRAEFARKVVDPEPEPYTVVHATASEGGTISPAGDVSVKTGESQMFAFTPDEGFVLDRVTVDGNPVVPIDGTYTLFDIVSEHDIRAEFAPSSVNPPQPIGYTVTATAGEHGSVSPEGAVPVEAGGSMRFDFQPDEGYELDQVLVDGLVKPASGLSYTLFDVQADATLHVTFKPKDEPAPPTVKHTVRASATPGGSIDPAGTFEVEDGASVTFRVAADEGYVLRALEINGENVSSEVRDGSYTVANMKADVSVVARFALEAKPPAPVPHEEFVISASVKGGHGSVSPAGSVHVAKGSSRAFYFYPGAGYAVSAVEIDGVQQAWTSRSYVFDNVQGNHALAVSFKPVAVPGGSEPKDPLDAIGTALTKTGDAPWALGAGVIACAAGAVALVAASRRRTRKEGASEDIRRR